MKLNILLNYALRNIWRSRLRSLFTLLSITLIMLLYTILASVVISFGSQFQKLFEQQQVDIIVQARYAVTPVSSFISEDQITQLSQLEYVSSASSVVLGRKRLEERGSFFIIGTNDFEKFFQTVGLNLHSGTLPEENKLVIGKKMAEVLRLQSGNILQLSSDKHYEISGVFESWLNFLNSAAVMKKDTAQLLLNRNDGANMVLLSLHEPAKSAKLISSINGYFPKLIAVDSIELPDHMGRIKSIHYLLQVVALVTLVLTFAILFNTFLLASNERTKEIGILGALGWTKLMIVTVMALEAIIFALLGAALGYLLSYGVLTWLQQHFSDIYMYLPASPDSEVIWHLFGIGISMGVLSTFYPALYATRINISRALRHE